MEDVRFALRCRTRRDWALPVPARLKVVACVPVLYAMLAVTAILVDGTNREVLRSWLGLVSLCLLAAPILYFARASSVLLTSTSILVDRGTPAQLVIRYEDIAGHKQRRGWIQLRTGDGRLLSFRPGLLHREDVVDYLWDLLGSRRAGVRVCRKTTRDAPPDPSRG